MADSDMDSHLDGTDTSQTDFASNELFVKIRSQANSNLENQKQAAFILLAVEETIKEQNERLSPLAYFGALMTILEQQSAAAAGDASKENIIVAVTYLLSIVFPRVPSNVLKLKFADITKTLSETLELHQQHAPLVRALIGCIEFLLVAQESSTWSSAEAKGLLKSLLFLCLDSRPKVRRRANDALRRVLSRPPPPALHHPGTIPTIDFCARHLEEYRSAKTSQEKKALETHVLHILVFLKMLLPVVSLQARHEKTKSKLKNLCQLLLHIPVRSSGSGNTILTQWIFQAMESLFTADSGETFPLLDIALVDSVIRELMEVRPYQNDVSLTPAWFDLLGRGFQTLALLVRETLESEDADPSSAEYKYAQHQYAKLVLDFFEATFAPVFGESNRQVIIQNAATAFVSMIQNSLVGYMVDDAASFDPDMGSAELPPLIRILNMIRESFKNVRFHDSWGAVLSIAEAVFVTLGRNSAELVHGLLEDIVTLRDDPSYGESFLFKKELESALQMAGQAIGIDTFLTYIPHNIENDRPNLPRRPYVLALLLEGLERPLPETKISSPTPFGPHSLRYFATEIMPLVKRMLDRSSELWGGATRKALEAKLYETLGTQAFGLLGGICASVPEDLGESFALLGPHLGRILQIQPTELFPNLPSEPDMRPLVCNALRQLIDSFVELSSEHADSENFIVTSRINSGLDRLKEYSTRFLATLCNNYSTVPPEFLESIRSKSKGQNLQVLYERENQHYEIAIKSFLKIADAEAIQNYFLNLVKTLLQSQTEQESLEGVEKQIVQLRNYAMLDLLLILLPFLPEVKDGSAPSQAGDTPLSLFYKVLSGQLRDDDPTLQKKTYKALDHVISVLTHNPKLLDLDDLIENLIDPDVLSVVASGAKKSRIQCLMKVADAIPPKKKSLLLQFVPVVLSEVMLATKEASERARNTAFECLVAMGKKMMIYGEEGKVKGLWDMTVLSKQLETSKGDDDDDEDDDDDDDDEMEGSEQEVSLREYTMMIVAGLAGSTVHMQSAAISSLSRVVFEFHEHMADELVKELITTILYFMASPSKEIVKAVLGFVKVVIVTLRQELLEDHLEEICVSILAHSRDHKSHFKSKVRHIFERLVRRFSYEAIEGFVPEQDRKLLVNIRKRRERLKKKKALERADESEDDDPTAPGAKARAAERAKKLIAQSSQRAFEDAVHGSESELDSDGEDLEQYLPERLRDGSSKSSQRGAAAETRIREDGDIIDFLDSKVVSKVTTAPTKKKTAAKDGSAKASFALGDDGRMIIEDEDDEDDVAGAKGADEAQNEAEDYYKETLTGEAAFVRLPNGSIKFLKANKRKRDGDADGDERDVGAKFPGFGGRIEASRGQEAAVAKMLGRQYKAKKAKGDIKKPNMPDPFAYIPLNSKIVGNKRKSTKMAGQFKTIIKATQRNEDVTLPGQSSGGPAGVKKQNKKHK
ncbi:armadillo-type protein [Polychytrium aggregatum]|uniref:armadillo-type protein n=1 Tax=Polychytrium aggregatum TaxID=110093 RepID=UPI0022FE49AE|nr:armadillo-type protein [Polychytrium aggregatum]KAI9209400.1 armadillo-type protein [Polychytrium aggregatum]